MKLDLFRAVILNSGPLALSGAREARFTRLRPIFQQVGGDPLTAALLAGIGWTESDFVADARNPQSGAAGIMQIMPFHFDSLGWRTLDWANPEKNIPAGLFILRQSGLGRLPIRATLTNYGGFITVDPREYVARVLDRSTILFPRMLGV